MTTTSVHPVVSPQRFRRRLVHAWRTLFAPGDLTALLIVLAMLVMPALALNRAGWPLSLPVVLPVIVLSTFFGLLLAHSQYNELLALIISALYGCCFVLLFAAFGEPGGLQQGVYSVFTRTVTWIVDAVSGGINQDDLVFTLLVAILFWFLGYNAAWHIFRIDRVWRVVLPPGLILAANAIFYDGDADLEFYMVGYFFMVLLLIVRSNLDERAWSWYVSGIRTPRAMHQQFLRIGAALALISLIFAWGVPSGNLQDRLDRFQNFLQSDPITQLGEFWNRLFTSVESEGPVTADYYGGDSLELGGAIRLGEQEVFFVSAPPTHRYYWRSRVFDTYDRGRWTPAADKRLTTPDSPLDIQYNPNDLGAREMVEQEFTLGLNTSRLIYTAPQPLQVSLPTRTDLRYVEDDTWNVSVIRPLKVIRRGDTYTAQSLISNATATQLRAVPPIYPEWIQVLYVNAPLSITERTVQLTNQIIAQAGAVTVYDKAKAVETWLRNNIVYNEIIPQPPLNQDPIDWVLFDLKEGYCEYYASAMIIMLRSMGIPARMAAGFSQGTWDAASQRYAIQERDAHTWVEVYFPGYGWIEFEPTAAQAPLNRIGDNEYLPQPTPLPAASPTPSPTVTPTILPTTTVMPNQQQDSVIPTITPTFTPSPTATPIIVPTQPPPIRPPQRGLLSFLLPTLGLALLGLLLIILLVGIMVFIWWWWEWRGMKGLSPVARAYARLERFAALVGIRFRPQQTPEERRQNILRDLPQSKRPVTAITRMYTVERYGPRQNPMEEPKTTQIAGRAWSEARSSILKRFLKRFVPWRRR